MAKYKYVLFLGFFCTSLFFTACESVNKKKKYEKELEKEVMAIHDEVMPKMKSLYDIKNELKTIQSELLQDTIKNSKALDELNRAIWEVEGAGEDMMLWMRNYKRPDDNQSHQEIIEFLTKEKDKVKQVKDKMLKSIEGGKKVLKKYRSNKE